MIKQGPKMINTQYFCSWRGKAGGVGQEGGLGGSSASTTCHPTPATPPSSAPEIPDQSPRLKPTKYSDYFTKFFFTARKRVSRILSGRSLCPSMHHKSHDRGVSVRGISSGGVLCPGVLCPGGLCLGDPPQNRDSPPV